MNVHQLRPRAAEFMCSSCGVDAGCNCGAPLVSKAQRAADAIAANPGKSDRVIAAELGIGKSTVNDVRNSTVRPRTVDDRPTIDSPPKGSLWDDQNDRPPETRIGKDGKERRMPTKKAAATPDQNKQVNQFCSEALEFIADFDHRFRVWLSQNTKLGATEKEALISSIQSCADGMSSLAQALR